MLEHGYDSPQYLRYVHPHADTSQSGINVVCSVLVETLKHI